MIKCCTCPACKGAFSLSLTPAFMRGTERMAKPLWCPYCATVLKLGGLGGQGKSAKLPINPWVKRVLAEAERKGKAMVTK